MLLDVAITCGQIVACLREILNHGGDREVAQEQDRHAAPGKGTAESGPSVAIPNVSAFRRADGELPPASARGEPAGRSR